jgi:hypothetical protein
MIYIILNEGNSKRSIIEGYGMETQRIGVIFPAGAKICIFTTASNQTIRPIQIPIHLGGSFPRAKAARE